MVIPPSALAPLQAASITPPLPPQIRMAPRLANSRPTDSATSASCGEHCPPPITAMNFFLFLISFIRIIQLSINISKELIILIHSYYQTFGEEAEDGFTYLGYDLGYGMLFIGGEIAKHIGNNISLTDFS